MNRFTLALTLMVVTGTCEAVDLKKMQRRLVKEPVYQTKSPGYVLLVIGPEAKDRVWLVRDGDILYVDRNGDGDLTSANEKVAAEKDAKGTFHVGELKLGGKTHAHLTIRLQPLKPFLSLSVEYAKRPDLLAALKADPDAEVMSMSGDFEASHIKAKGRVSIRVGPIDADGPLLAAKTSADAPIVHIGGRVQVAFVVGRPTMRHRASTQFLLAAGTPGLGGGTFAEVAFDDTIPSEVHPIADISFPPAKEGGEAVKQRFELKDRC